MKKTYTTKIVLICDYDDEVISERDVEDSIQGNIQEMIIWCDDFLQTLPLANHADGLGALTDTDWHFEKKSREKHG